MYRSFEASWTLQAAVTAYTARKIEWSAVRAVLRFYERVAAKESRCTLPLDGTLEWCDATALCILRRHVSKGQSEGEETNISSAGTGD